MREEYSHKVSTDIQLAYIYIIYTHSYLTLLHLVYMYKTAIESTTITSTVSSKHSSSPNTDNNNGTKQLLLDGLFKEYPSEHMRGAVKEWCVHFTGPNSSLVYGEISLDCLMHLFTTYIPIQHTKGGIFYDLGSGTGKALLSVAVGVNHLFDSLVGIEVQAQLYAISESVLNDFLDSDAGTSTCNASIRFIEGDVITEDWSNGTVVLANSTCFSLELMKELAVKGEELCKGAYFVTCTKGLDSLAFDLVDSFEYRMHWGVATVLVHRRNGRAGKKQGKRCKKRNSHKAERIHWKTIN